ncbi:peptidase A1 family protein [Abortiporus biennis]
MKYIALPLTLVVLASLTDAAKFPFKRHQSPPSLQRRSGSGSISKPKVLAASSGSDGSTTIDSVHDLLYLADITVGGQDYVVQLDTGSSDLWIKGQTFPLPNSKLTSTSWNLTYGIGWANGTVAYAPVQFAGISIPQQAFMDVASAQNPALGYGADGIAGLGFTSLSTIDALLNHTGSATGRSLLYNAFADNVTEPNFISFVMERGSDASSTADGVFTIGEVDSQYSDVTNSQPLSTWPVAYPQRWNVLLDAVLVAGGDTISVSTTVNGAPSNKAVVSIDTGTSYIYAPEDVVTGIYGSVQGAKYDSSIGQWIIPCDAEIDIALQFGGIAYPMHPLDVAPASLTDPTQCVGSFIPQSVAVGAGQFDWLLGDAFLRSVYAVYDFGDFDSSGKMGNPYIKFLSLVDPNNASSEFHAERGGSSNGQIVYNSANVTSSGTTVSISGDLANTINKINTYFPILLAIMGLNALVIIVLLIGGLVYCLKKRQSRARRRTNLGRMSPRPFARRTTTFDMPAITEPHSYQPVSMALTEDTFVPPTPAFSKRGFDESSMMSPKDVRPMSVA